MCTHRTQTDYCFHIHSEIQDTLGICFNFIRCRRRHNRTCCARVCVCVCHAIAIVFVVRTCVLRAHSDANGECMNNKNAAEMTVDNVLNYTMAMRHVFG